MAAGGCWAIARRRLPGPGYALENRAIIARVLPGLVNELATRPLTAFFNALREGLARFADDDSAPLVVVLTPGPFNETYFEHAYLARHLGLPLVQGQDLTVRADTVYLKTLSGLRRVHAILRRLDDDYCDPLELRADSALGVPGLLGRRARRARGARQCAGQRRAGVGGLAGLSARRRASCCWASRCGCLRWRPGGAASGRHSSMRLRTWIGWWSSRRFPIRSSSRASAAIWAEEDRAQLIARLRGRPYAYVAQERMSLSQAPTWRAGANVRLAPRTLTMRVYAVARPDGYEVMPGGLARIAAEGVVDIVSSQRGGGSKDVWVLADPDAATVPASSHTVYAADRSRTTCATTNCPRSWWRICTGSGATPSAARTRRGCCAPRWRCAPMPRSGASRARNACATAC